MIALPFYNAILAHFPEVALNNIALYYMNDIVILSSTEEEGIKRFKKFLKIASEYGLEIKKNKCQFLQKRVEFLGFIIKEGTIQKKTLLQ